MPKFSKYYQPRWGNSPRTRARRKAPYEGQKRTRWILNPNGVSYPVVQKYNGYSWEDTNEWP